MAIALHILGSVFMMVSIVILTEGQAWAAAGVFATGATLVGLGHVTWRLDDVRKLLAELRGPEARLALAHKLGVLAQEPFADAPPSRADEADASLRDMAEGDDAPKDT